ncbi:hypothetical protein [Listeria ilorinensis]|uniref:hypothetical protein n=1 Tax=Listeria ilorinensis TaxID=2867439 RepID=UPI001EF612E7|nr:hypothetical protein [Listeria ilorinensis]
MFGGSFFAKDALADSVEDYNEVAKEHGMEPVDSELVDALEVSRLEFDSVEEFEAFLEAEEETEYETVVEVPKLLQASGTKTYSTVISKTPVMTIKGYAKVTRNRSGVVTNVTKWSQQTGVAWPIGWEHVTAYHSLNSSKKGGTTTIKGNRLYYIMVPKKELSYKRGTTAKINF